MLELVKAWFYAVLVDPKVRAGLWGLVALVLGVEVPFDKAAMTSREVFLLGVATGWLIPHVREFVNQKSLPDEGEKKP